MVVCVEQDLVVANGTDEHFRWIALVREQCRLTFAKSVESIQSHESFHVLPGPPQVPAKSHNPRIGAIDDQRRNTWFPVWLFIYNNKYGTHTTSSYTHFASSTSTMEQQLNQLTPEQRRAILMEAQQQANQQVMQDMVQRMVKTCFTKCAGTSVSAFLPEDHDVCC